MKGRFLTAMTMAGAVALAATAVAPMAVAQSAENPGDVLAPAERETFTQDQLDKILALARKGIEELITLQNDALGVAP